MDDMVPGAPHEARWIQAGPRRTLPRQLLERIVPGAHAIDAQPLTDGLRNSNFKLYLDGKNEPLVLRLYEHDPSLCQKEVDLIRLVTSAVPVPELLHAEPRGLDGLPPFTLTRYVEGITFRDLKRLGDPEAMAQASYSAGQILAAIGRFAFSKPGWIAPGPAVTSPLLEGSDPIPRFVDLCLASANLQRRVALDLRAATHEWVWAWAPQLAGLDSETHLVHGDFNKRNLIVHSSAGVWSVAAVLDWEFAVSGSPLADIGNFLRYERAERPTAEPHFSSGYLQAGGTLPRDWRRLAQVFDLAALCESLRHDQLPDSVTAELVGLVRATVEPTIVAFRSG